MAYFVKFGCIFSYKKSFFILALNQILLATTRFTLYKCLMSNIFDRQMLFHVYLFFVALTTFGNISFFFFFLCSYNLSYTFWIFFCTKKGHQMSPDSVKVFAQLCFLSHPFRPTSTKPSQTGVLAKW